VKKIILTSLFLMLFTTPAYANFYSFEGAEQSNFGKSTSFEPVEVLEVRETENIKRNKDSAFIPPRFGSRTADTPETGELLTPNISGVEPMRLGGTGENLYIYAPSVPAGSQSGAAAPNSWTTAESIMQADGSIGRLEIPRVSLNVKVFEGEDNLSRGVGHFRVTSAWNGLVGIAGHNRGVNAYFGRIHELRNGDIITYSTSLGVRNYAVYSVTQVNEYNTSVLNPTADNIITLVTCVRNTPSMRWVVQARQI
jgi:sortase A